MKKNIFLIVLILLSGAHLSQAQSGGSCVNGGGNDPDCPPVGTEDPADPADDSTVGSNPILAGRANLHRKQYDLTIYGPASFSFGRIYNSRTSTWTNRSWELGTNNTWQHNWQYEMRESSQTNFGFKQIILRYPEGREYYFSAVDSTGSVRVPQANWGDRLYPTGTNAYLLRTPTGKEYVFSRVGPNSNYQYLLNEVRDGKGYKWTLTYATQSDGKHRLTQIANNFGRSISISREPSTASGYWRITNLTANDGRVVNFNYTTWTNTSEPVLSSVSYPGGETSTYTWAGSTSLTTGAPVMASAVDPTHKGAGSRCKYLYNYTASYPDSYGLVKGTILEERNFDTNQLIVSLPNGGAYSPTIIEGNGTSLIRKFSSVLGGNDNLEQVGDGAGRNIFHTYSAGGAGYRTSSTDDAGAVTTFTPDYAGHVTAIVDANGKTSSATYSPNGFVLTKTDKLNRTTTHTRNASNQITRTDYPDGSYETFTYNTNGQPLTHRLKSGANETNTYDSSGNLITQAIAYNNGTGTTVTDTTTHTYFTNGLRSSTTDPRGNTVSYLYDWRGQNTRITFPGGSYKQFAYDAYGNMTSQTDELGHTWSKTYTEYNEVASITDPLGRTTNYQYGQEPGCSSCGYRPTLTRITLPSGKKIEYSYDHGGKRISAKFGAGSTDEATTTYAYDNVGNLVVATDPRGKITTYGYDFLHRKTSETDPLLHTTSYLYDDKGNTLRITREDTTYTAMTYDSADRVLTMRNPNNETTTFTYFTDGTLATLTDARSNAYNFIVDGRSRRTRMTYPGGSYENWTYDGAGNLSVYTARNGVTRTYTYDTRNRNTLSDWSDSTPDVTKTYDNASRLLTLNNANSELTYYYDIANQLTSEKQKISGGPGVQFVVYSYNQDGNRASLDGPNIMANYYYTGRNQVAVIEADHAPAVFYSYDLSGNRTTRDLYIQSVSVSTFDDANRVTNISQTGANFDYIYNTVNNRTSKTTTAYGSPILKENYGFDAADQLTNVSYLSGSSLVRSTAYNYDAVGNRISTTDGSLTTPYAANALNQYTSIDSLSNPVYSNTGNVASIQFPSVAGNAVAAPWTYTYDSQNRLLTATNGSSNASFLYDGKNRQVARTINGSTTYFIYDGWSLVGEYAGGTLQASYLHGGQTDEIIFKTSLPNYSRTYFEYDALGSVVAVLGEQGDLLESYRYDAFGTPQIFNAAGNSITTSAYNNRFMFTGREWLADLGIYDYRNRQYSPQIGRFLQTDPIRFNGNDTNLYRYVENSPTKWVDPTGEVLSGKDIASLVVSILSFLNNMAHTIDHNFPKIPQTKPASETRRENQKKVDDKKPDDDDSAGPGPCPTPTPTPENDDEENKKEKEINDKLKEDRPYFPQIPEPSIWPWSGDKTGY